LSPQTASRRRRKRGSEAPPRRVHSALRGHHGTRALLCILVFLFDPGLWISIWNADLPHAWDGSGHYARAAQYAQSIFPDTFGWVPNYYAGMPFPNYYPPCFYWLVAALARFTPLSLHSAFLLVLGASAFAIPLAIWCLARAAGGRKAAGILAAVAVFPLLFDKRSFFPLGLSHPGTFFTGLYTQPLGFIFLALWYASFLRARHALQWFGSALLLALMLVSNLFGAAAAALLWAGTLGHNLVRAIGAHAPSARKRLAGIAAHQAATLPIALLLAGFWLFPTLIHGSFLIARPVHTPDTELINPLLPIWYAVAAAGIILWLRRPTAAAVPMVITLALGYAGLFISRQAVPVPWFPLYVPRFLTCLNFLLAVPVGIALSEGTRFLVKQVRERMAGVAPATRGDRGGLRVAGGTPALGYRTAAIPVMVGAMALLLMLRVLVQTPDYRLAFYSDSNRDFRRVEPILEFARAHREGRYAVEHIPFARAGPALDGQALSAYLGMQGNDVANGGYREASISSVFINPLIGAMSAGKDNFGLSSILSEDAEFLSQSMERHLRQAEVYRVRYFVVFSEATKRRLARFAECARYDFGEWSVFESKTPPRPEAMPLSQRPVLLLTSFSAKLTRRSDYHFLRLAQEEFIGSPGLPLAFHPDYRADRLPEAELFSALVVESYRYRDTATAFEQIKRFSRKKPVVLVEGDDPLFRTCKDRQAEMGKVFFVDRVPADDTRWIGTGSRAVSYRNNAVRQTWKNIKAALAPALEGEPAEPAASCELTRSTAELRIRCYGRESGRDVPVSINTSFHPCWRAHDGRPVLMLGPNLMYAAVGEDPLQLRFRRSRADVAAAICSALALFVGLAWALRGGSGRRPLAAARAEFPGS